jgi:drug/metabolite transporter (DMT)-like permease
MRLATTTPLCGVGRRCVNRERVGERVEDVAVVAAWFWIAVAVRISANPLSNALQKWLSLRGVAAGVVIFATHLLLSFAVAPLVLLQPLPTHGAFWLNMATAVLLAVAGNTLIVHAMKLDDLSILGPINAFKPIVSLVPAWLLLGEAPGPLGLAGIGLVVAGSFALADRRALETRITGIARLFTRRGVQLRVAALVLSGIEAVFLKRALVGSTPTIAFTWWSILGVLPAAGAVAFLPSPLAQEGPRMRGLAEQRLLFRRYCRQFLLLAITTGLMQFTTLVTFTSAPVASALALFQLSAIFSVLLGHRLFAEPHLLRRLLGSTIMSLGAALILLDR